jgi:hypothetical protein
MRGGEEAASFHTPFVKPLVEVPAVYRNIKSEITAQATPQQPLLQYATGFLLVLHSLRKLLKVSVQYEISLLLAHPVAGFFAAPKIMRRPVQSQVQFLRVLEKDLPRRRQNYSAISSESQVQF